MIRPAICYKDEIMRKSQELFYSDEMFFYNGYYNNQPINVTEDDEDGSIYQFAIVGKDNDVKGYMSFRYDYNAKNAYNFGLISFEKGSIDVAYGVKDVIDFITKKLKAHRMEFRMIGGNPVKRHYDRFVRKYNGTVYHFHDVCKNRQGEYLDDYIYEVIFDE